MAAESIKAFDARLFEKILKSKFANADYRRKIYRKLLTDLVETERLETTLQRAKDLSRIANRVRPYLDLQKFLGPLGPVVLICFSIEIFDFFCCFVFQNFIL